MLSGKGVTSLGLKKISPTRVKQTFSIISGKIELCACSSTVADCSIRCVKE